MIRTLPWTVSRPALVLFLAIAASTGRAVAAEPLHLRIDRLVEAPLILSPAAGANDADFLRRISLDLCNRIASLDEMREFLQDSSADKRPKAIERMLASPQHARRLANFLDVTLMERRGDKYVPGPDWQNWLYQACLDNRPWDQMARELLTADGAEPARRSPAKFSLEREADPHLLTRDVGRLFFGRDVQCAQCHDHPNVKDYEQREYYGLLSFFQRTELFKDASGAFMLAEKAEGDASYESVFKKDSKYSARPALPGGITEPEPPMKPGDEYIVKPEGKNRPVPKFSRRELLARTATAGANRAFNRNIVNRLWAMMMGRGLVHPVDFDHPDNPPTHPELLDLLADEFVAMKYDIRAMLRELALTKTYQRSFDLPPDFAAGAVVALPALEGEFAAAEKAVEAATAAMKAARRDALAVQETVELPLNEQRAAEAALVSLRKASGAAFAAVAETQRQAQAKGDAYAALANAIEHAKLALAKLPADADLKQVVEKLQAKATQFKTDLQTLATTAKTQADAAKQANDKIAASEKSIADLAAKVKLAEETSKPAVTTYTEKRRAQQRVKAALAVCERRVLAAKSLIDYRAKLDLLAKAESQAGPVPHELDSARRAKDDAMANLTAFRRRLAGAEKAHLSQQHAVAAAKDTLSQRLAVLEALTVATGQMDKAAAAIKDDELSKVAAAVKQRHAAGIASHDAAKKQLAEREAACQTALAQCESLRKEKAGLEEAAAATSARVAGIEEQHKKPLAELREAQARASSARQDLLERVSECYAVAPLKPLSAEQMHWSVLQATGILDSTIAAANAELAKKQPPPDAKTRSVALERDVHAKLAGNLGPFIKLFGCGPGQTQFEFFATADQALFMENSDTIRAWTAPGVTLIQRLAKHTQPAAFADDLYLAVLNRKPTDEEAADVAKWLSRHGGPTATSAAELAWAVLASVEFRFNH